MTSASWSGLSKLEQCGNVTRQLGAR